MIKTLMKIGGIFYKKMDNHMKFITDPLADYSYISKGLEDHTGKGDDAAQREIVGRILAAYKKSKKDQENVPAPYKPAGCWDDDIKTRRADYLAALQAEDVDILINLLKNFFRNNGVSGTCNYCYFNALKNGKVDKKWFANIMVRDYYILVDFINNFKASDVPPHRVGNPWGYYINGTLFQTDTFRHIYFANHINNLLADIQNPVVGEIGGGYGGFSYYLMHYNDSLKYLDFDLPEILMISQYFLMNLFPEKKFLLYGENENKSITAKTIEEYDVILMPNFALQWLEDKSVDLFTNMGSLSEMDYITIEEYIKRIIATSRVYFFHENSDRYQKQNFGFVETPASAFPIPPEIFKRIYKAHSKWGTERYREILYQRISN